MTLDVPIKKKLKLHGFNNLTKTLSFNIYDICYTQTASQCRAYLCYIDEVYNAERLTNILVEVSRIIGANVLNVSHQDYDPQGASVTMLISEEPVTVEPLTMAAAPEEEEPGPLSGASPHASAGSYLDLDLRPETVVAHLDKSHLTVHTYPESHPENGISTFRADIDVSTCGRISPLRALNYLIHTFESDIVTMDYRVRGFTRDVSGKKHFIDHKINSIQNFLATDTKDKYNKVDVNVYQENIFHTKMMVKHFDLNNYLFGAAKEDLPPEERKRIKRRLKREMAEIFYGRNIPKMP
ncbi:S-adenosylmethionine decarboxylase proenzyme [Gammaproteobacteria bacterium]